MMVMEMAYNKDMEEESKIVDYKDIKVKVIKHGNVVILEYAEDPNGAHKMQLFCDDDSERFFEKLYLMVKNPGLFVG